MIITRDQQTVPRGSKATVFHGMKSYYDPPELYLQGDSEKAVVEKLEEVVDMAIKSLKTDLDVTVYILDRGPPVFLDGIWFGVYSVVAVKT